MSWVGTCLPTVLPSESNVHQETDHTDHRAKGVHPGVSGGRQYHSEDHRTESGSQVDYRRECGCGHTVSVGGCLVDDHSLADGVHDRDTVTYDESRGEEQDVGMGRAEDQHPDYECDVPREHDDVRPLSVEYLPRCEPGDQSPHGDHHVEEGGRRDHPRLLRERIYEREDAGICEVEHHADHRKRDRSLLEQVGRAEAPRIRYLLFGQDLILDTDDQCAHQGQTVHDHTDREHEVVVAGGTQFHPQERTNGTGEGDAQQEVSHALTPPLPWEEFGDYVVGACAGDSVGHSVQEPHYVQDHQGGDPEVRQGHD